MHDPSKYPSPSSFDPDRYTSDKSYGEVNEDPRPIAFGFGRRLWWVFIYIISAHIENLIYLIFLFSPGKFLADASLWANIAFVLSVFDISPAIDRTTGLPVLPDVEVDLSNQLVRWGCLRWWLHIISLRANDFRCLAILSRFIVL